MPKKGLATEFRRRREQAGLRNIDDKTVATLTVRVRDLTAEEQKGMADWICQQAAFIRSNAGKMAPTYTARYCAR